MSSTDPASPDPRGAIGKAAMIILSLTLVDKVLALGKEILIAARYGVGPALDVFNLAYATPGLLGLIIEGAVVSALVPLVIDWQRDHGPGAVRDRVMTVVTACLAGALLLTLAGLLLAPAVFPLLGYGFGPAEVALGVRLSRMLMLLVALEGGSAVLAGLLRSWKAFAAVTAAQLPINAALIACLALGRAGDIDLLVLGTLAGTALKACWLTVAVSRRTPLLAPFRWQKPALTEFTLLALPLLGGGLIANSNLLVDQSMASQLSPGGISTLRYAYRINDLPLQLIVIAITKAILPFISEQVSRGDAAAIRRLFGQSLASLGHVAFPAMAFVMLFTDDIVTALLGRGAFDAEAARGTALTLRCYTAGLFFFAYAFVNGAFFSALKRARVLFFVGLGTLGLNFGLNALFLRLFGGAESIALSSTVTGALLTLVFLGLLRRPLGLTNPFRPGIGLVPPAAATLAAAIPCLLLRGPLTSATLPVLVRLGLEGGLFLVLLVPALILIEPFIAEAYRPLWDTSDLFRLLRRRNSGKRGNTTAS